MHRDRFNEQRDGIKGKEIHRIFQPKLFTVQYKKTKEIETHLTSRQ